MKKLTVLILSIVFFVLVTGCNGGTSESVYQVHDTVAYTENAAIPLVNEMPDEIFFSLKDTTDCISVNDELYITIAPVAEQFGFEVLWDEKNNTVEIYSPDRQICFYIGEKKAVVNGDEINLQASVEIAGKRPVASVIDLCKVLNLYTAREDENNTEYYVWFSKFAMLGTEDYEDENNYTMDPSGIPVFYLNENSKTNRGIKLGDSYEDVISAYGPGMFIEDSNTLVYYMPMYPASEFNSIEFIFSNNIVTEVIYSY